MSLSEFEKKRIEKVLDSFINKRRPPPHVRPKLDYSYTLKNQSVEIFEIRPQWNNPTKKIAQPIAKATYVRTKNIWKVFWQRADLKWHGYEPEKTVDSIEKFVRLVDKDQYSCFFG